MIAACHTLCFKDPRNLLQDVQLVSNQQVSFTDRNIPAFTVVVEDRVELSSFYHVQKPVNVSFNYADSMIFFRSVQHIIQLLPV